MAQKKTPKGRKKPAKKRSSGKQSRNKTQARSWLRRAFGFSFRYLLLPTLIVAAITLFILDGVVRAKFSGTKWTLPTHVYSRTLDIYTGLEINRENIIWELEQLGYRRVSTPSTRPSSTTTGPSRAARTSSGPRRRPSTSTRSSVATTTFRPARCSS